ncbi:MAG TPA: sigma-54 dependent transcriptional regulator [Rickettsiales bacterium]|nr:sigma-54 dependent transcriptional regulator [Rickettsiales bacterium]
MTADILIVDDEADIRELVSDILKDENYHTRSAKDSDSTIKALAERVPSLLILDIWLHGSELDGLGILELVQKKYPGLPVIMISGHGNIETAVSAIKMGAYDFIEKPFQADHLISVTRRALEHSKLRRENNELKLRGAAESHLIGTSNTVNHIRQAVEKIAPTHSRIMISGPAGSGKEVIARLIHNKSRRATGEFVVMNAASMTTERVDVELFGIEDSSPGGGAEKVGLFERAHGGTLFIDEVTDMPLETQARLLRLLQEQAFERVRGNKKVQVDVRVIAASNRDVSAEIAAGRFREDLYYRLNVVPIRMPALKERREDIPELCRYFLKRAAETSGLSQREITEDAIAVLQAYHWPGNVRHLRNMMEWLLIMAPGGSKAPIKSDMLPKELFETNAVVMRPEVNSDIMSMPLREARELFEKQYLAAQINRFGGNISKTSCFVGMERSALHRKLKLLGIGSAEEKEEKVA